MKSNILTTRDSFKTISREAKKCEVETGGIIVGTFGDTITIVAAGGSGENSVHHSVQYTSDPDADRRCLAQAREKFGDRITTVGWWHKHPSGFERPSGGDIMQVRQLSEEYGDGKPVLMGIVNQYKGILRDKITLKLYSIGSDDGLIEHDWALVFDNDKELLDEISKASVVPGTKPSAFWADSDFRFHLNPIGRERIIRERDGLLEAGYQVICGQRRHDNMFTMEVSDVQLSLLLLFPPEFPLNSPIVYSRHKERLGGLSSIMQWNSLSSLTSVVEEALSILSCRHCKQRHIVIEVD